MALETRSLQDAFGSVDSAATEVGTARKTPSLGDSSSSATARAKAVNREREVAYQQDRMRIDRNRYRLARANLPGLRISPIDLPSVAPIMYYQPDDCGLEIERQHETVDGGLDRFNFEWRKSGSNLRAAIAPYLNHEKTRPPLNILHLVGWALNKLANKRGTITQIEGQILHDFPVFRASTSRNLLRQRIDKLFLEEESKYNKVLCLADKAHQPQASLAKRDMVWEMPLQRIDYIFAEFYGKNLSVGVEAPSASLMQPVGLFEKFPDELLVIMLKAQLRIGKVILVRHDPMRQVPSHAFFDDEKRGSRVQLALSDVLAIAEVKDEKFRIMVHEVFFGVNTFSFPNLKVFLIWLHWLGAGNRLLVRSVIVRLTPVTDLLKDLKLAFCLLGQSEKLAELDIRLIWWDRHPKQSKSLTSSDWFAVLEDICLRRGGAFRYVRDCPKAEFWTRDRIAPMVEQQEMILKTFMCRNRTVQNGSVHQPGSGRDLKIQLANNSPEILDHDILKRWAKEFGLPNEQITAFSKAQLAQYIASR